MPYRKYPPHALLRPYVTDYYLWESGDVPLPPFSLTSPANPRWAMIFNYGSPYRLHNDRHRGTTLPAQFFSGQSTGPYTLELSGQIAMAGIIFTSRGPRELFALPPLDQFLDDRADLTNLIGPAAAEVTEQLATARSPQQKIDILDRFLLARLPKATHSPSPAVRAAELILHHRGMIAMDEVARRVYLSPRQMRRTFKAELGINPKFFARLKRFNYVNRCLTNGTDFSWQHFLREGAFYDQSHFIKDYQTFFGSNPKAQIAENRRVVARLEAPVRG